MNILFVSSEVSPFAKTGGLGDVSEILPMSLNKLGENCSVITPFYRLVRKNGYSPEIVKKDIRLKIGAKDYTFDLMVIDHKKTKFYFIKNDGLYDREHLYGVPGGDYDDNMMRFGLFSRAVLASIPYIGRPDIIHCNDWQSGPIPMYIKKVFTDNPDYKETRILFTIHNIAYQGLFSKDVLPLLDIPEDLFNQDGIEFWGKVSFMKAGLIYSDAISTVSEGYSREILTREFGCGLDGLLSSRKDVLYGIINGADYSTWNPGNDKFLAKNYGADTLEDKKECKKDLVNEFGIPFDDNKPLIGMITRLAEQKGVDLIVEAMEELIEMGANFVILGTGDERYNELFKKFGTKYKSKAGARVAFNNALAHKIEAGSDMFLMPSRYEPCGLNQMYSLKYGTVPVVRATGGLDDTIEDFDTHTLKGNGFKFKKATREDMLEAVKRAVEVYKDKDMWRTLQKNGLKNDFSWEASAKKYIELYNIIKKCKE